jgi:2-hydroxy-6-oxonona-2,4-dienedioate hydrolase
VAFITQLGAGPAHVAGISDGGVVALHLGIHHPEVVRTLVCTGGNYYLDTLLERLLQINEPGFIERNAPDVAADLARRHDPAHYPGYWRDLVRQIQENNARNTTYTDDDLQRIGAPALVIAGELDPIANIDQMLGMKRNIPHAEWLIVNHAGHDVHHSHAWLVGRQVLDFLRRHDQAGLG